MKTITDYQLNIGFINRYTQQIIKNIKKESLVVYLFLHDRWKKTEACSEDELFQFVFRSFYRMDSAGLSEDFKKQFFILMNENKRKNNPNIYDICLKLYEIKNLKNQNSIQFSFVTKLANTINTSLPIYDSEVAKMYGYNQTPTKDHTERLRNLTEFYTKISSDYKLFIKNGVFEKILLIFDKEFSSLQNRISITKKLDFIIWSAGKLLKKANARRL
jgi:hypothetical protein